MIFDPSDPSDFKCKNNRDSFNEFVLENQSFWTDFRGLRKGPREKLNCKTVKGDLVMIVASV